MSYKPYSVQLSEGQLKTLTRAYKNKDAVTLRLDEDQLKGDNKLMLTQTQINKIRNAIKDQKGMDLKISQSQMSKIGGGWGFLVKGALKRGAKAGMRAAPKVGKKALSGLSTGAYQSLGSFAADKFLGRGLQNRPPSGRGIQNRPYGRGIQNRPYYIPYENLHNMRGYTNLLTTKQLKDMQNAAKVGRGINIKLTKRQSGGFLGPLLASIGIPIAIEAISKIAGSGFKKNIT